MQAPGYQFDHNGATYYIPRITQGDRKRWQVWANGHAIAQAQANKEAVDAGWMSPETYQDLLETAKSKAIAGKFHPLEREGAELLGTEDGYTMFATIVMQRHDPHMTRAKVEALMQSMGPASFLEHWKIAQDSPDPLPDSPASAGTTTSSTPLAS